MNKVIDNLVFVGLLVISLLILAALSLGLWYMLAQPTIESSVKAGEFIGSKL